MSEALAPSPAADAAQAVRLALTLAMRGQKSRKALRRARDTLETLLRPRLPEGCNVVPIRPPSPDTLAFRAAVEAALAGIVAELNGDAR
jgi:hypothetical protein